MCIRDRRGAQAAFGGAAKPEVGVLLARSSRGTVHSCGCSEHGRLGRPARGTWGKVLLGDESAVSVAAADVHCLAVTQEGSLLVWGGNDRGQLGCMPGAPIEVPASVPALEGLPVAGAACSADSTLALLADGRVFAMGGPQAAPPAPLPLPARAAAVYGGGLTLGVLLTAGLPPPAAAAVAAPTEGAAAALVALSLIHI